MDIFAQDTLSDYTSSTTDNHSESGATLDPAPANNTTTNSLLTSAVPIIITTTYATLTTHLPATAKSQSFDDNDSLDFANSTTYTFDKSLLRTTESTWEPVPPSLRFGLPTNQRRRGRPQCCRRVRENEKKEARKLKCKNGSLFSRDARGRRRRKCRRRNRCKTRCKAHYKNTAWSIVGTMMKGLDFFLPKLEFKFHTGTLVFGTKFFSGLVPFLQAKMQAMHFFYSLFEPLLDGVLDALDFGRIGFRSMSILDDDDDEDDEEDKQKVTAEGTASAAVIVDEKYDAEKLEDYDDSDISPDISMAKNDLVSLPENDDDMLDGLDDDEGYDSPKDEPVDEDYGIDEDWDGEDDDDDNIVEDDDEEEGEEEYEAEDDLPKRITLPKPQSIHRRPLRPKPTRKKILAALIPSKTPSSDQLVIQEFMNRIKDDRNNFTVYHSNVHSNLVGNYKQAKPIKGGASSSTAGSASSGLSAILSNRLKPTINDTQVLNVDNLVLNINANKPSNVLYEDDVEYQEDPADEADDDKLITDYPTSNKPYKRVKAKPAPFSSFSALFGAISDAFDAYFSGTY